MNPVIDLSELCPRTVSDKKGIDALRRFQMNRYFESGLLDKLPPALPNDPTVADSTYFGIYDGDEIHATARIVRATTGLPMLKHHSIYPDILQVLEDGSGTVGEVSRLAVGRQTPHYRALALLSREFLRYGLRNQHATLLVASVEKPMVRILNRLLGVPLTVIGPTIEKYGSYNGKCVPILIDTVACLDSFRQEGSRRWAFFVEGLHIEMPMSQSLRTSDRLTQVAS